MAKWSNKVKITGTQVEIFAKIFEHFTKEGYRLVSIEHDVDDPCFADVVVMKMGSYPIRHRVEVYAVVKILETLV